MVMTEVREAHENGAAAARSGKLLTANPYPGGSQQALHWMAGWKEAWAELFMKMNSPSRDKV